VAVVMLAVELQRFSIIHLISPVTTAPRILFLCMVISLHINCSELLLYL